MNFREPVVNKIFLGILNVILYKTPMRDVTCFTKSIQPTFSQWLFENNFVIAAMDRKGEFAR